MRILEVSTARIWGGGEVHLRDLCFGLLRRGHEVAVACLRDSPAYDTLSRDGLPVVPLTGNTLDLARYAARQRMDLVHAHQSKGAHLAAAVHFLAGRPRAILTRHVLAPAHDLPPLGLARVIAVSQAASAGCLAGGISPSMLTVVPNGIDPHRYRPDFPPADRGRLGVPPEATLAVLAGRLAKDKGVPAAIEALLPLLARCELYLVLAGDGKKRPRLERIVQRAGLGRKVIFLGWQPDVRPFLAAADLVLAPGPGEAFGLAALEAMAMGRPVVAVEAGGVPEIIEAGVSGLLVPPGDGIALAAAVHRLATRPELGQKLGAAARARALEFTLDKMVERTEEVMEQTIRSRLASARSNSAGAVSSLATAPFAQPVFGEAQPAQKIFSPSPPGPAAPRSTGCRRESGWPGRKRRADPSSAGPESGPVHERPLLPGPPRPRGCARPIRRRPATRAGASAPRPRWCRR